MNRDDFERLAGSVLEGGLDTGERERIERMLSSDPEWRESWEDLRAAREALASARLEEASAGRQSDIMRAIAREERATRRPTWIEGLVAAFRARPALVNGVVLAIGVAAVVIAIGALTGGFDAGRKFAPSTVATVPVTPEAAAPVTLDVGGAQLEARLIQEGPRAYARLRATGAESGRAVLEWDQENLKLVALDWGAGDGGSGVEARPGRLEVELSSAHVCDATLQVEGDSPGTIRVTLETPSGVRTGVLRPGRAARSSTK